MALGKGRKRFGDAEHSSNGRALIDIVWRRVVPVVAALACAGVLVAAAVALWPALAPSSSSPASFPAPTGGAAPGSGSPSSGSPPASNATPPGGPTPPPTDSPPPSNGTSGNLTLALSLPKTSYQLGQTVSYVVTVTNVGNTTESFARIGCDPWLLVTNATGVVVYSLSGLMCPMIATPVTLNPGQSLSINGTWTMVNSWSRQQVPAGQYGLSVWWNVGWADLQSNLVTIVILGS